MLHVYTTENVATKSFSPWQFIPQDFDSFKNSLHGQVIMFPDRVKDEQHLYQYSKVHYIGTFDEQTGKVSLFDHEEIYDLASEVAQLDSLRRQIDAVGSNN